jgi:molybdopterin-guanine dinucleotide biosynthesis protein A
MAEQIVGVLLAGGLARRMGGGDKCLRLLGGKPILAHIIERVRAQVSALVLNANGDPARFAAFDLPVVPDVVAGFAGPLAGVLTGMEWARAHAASARWLASFATDSPFVPCDLVVRLLDAARHENAPLACAASNGRTHPVMGLWSLDLAGELRSALVEQGMRKIDAWTARYKLATVAFEADPIDPFFNVNSPDELAEAERLIVTPPPGPRPSRRARRRT